MNQTTPGPSSACGSRQETSRASTVGTGAEDLLITAWLMRAPARPRRFLLPHGRCSSSRPPGPGRRLGYVRSAHVRSALLEIPRLLRLSVVPRPSTVGTVCRQSRSAVRATYSAIRRFRASTKRLMARRSLTTGGSLRSRSRPPSTSLRVRGPQATPSAGYRSPRERRGRGIPRRLRSAVQHHRSRRSTYSP